MKNIPFTDAHTHHLPEEENVFACVDLSGKEELFSPEKGSLFYSLGLHPAETENASFPQLEEKVHLLPFLSAIGECGMDKYLPIDLKKQQELFLQQAQLAAEKKMPLIIHCVKAWDLLYECAKKFPAEKRKWLIHSFRGSPALAEDLLRHGFFLSLAPQMILHMQSGKDQRWKEMAFLLETDDSNLDISFLYRKLAEEFQMDVETLKQKNWRIFQQFFDTVQKEKTEWDRI